MAEERRFACQPGCIACCTQKGWVYLTEQDILNAASFVKMTQAAFEKRYVYRTKNRRRLRMAAASQCPFLLESGCSIHPVKPVQCRIFPFWPEMLESRKEWFEAAKYCPGIGKGDLVQIETAQRDADEMRAAYPHMYASR